MAVARARDQPAERSPLRLSPWSIATLLLALALVSWVVTFRSRKCRPAVTSQ
jgi:hypothetical protein